MYISKREMGLSCISAFELVKSLFQLISFFLAPIFETSSSCYDVEKDTLAFTKVDTFLPNKIYYQGCLKAFLKITKWNGPEVLLHGHWPPPSEHSDTTDLFCWLNSLEHLKFSEACKLIY